ncbi:MAG: hypothetical protein V4494_03170 [Chlamydiota bacterium]
MPSIAGVTLKDGFEVPEAILHVVTRDLDTLVAKRPDILLELLKKCENFEYKFNNSFKNETQEILRAYNLIDRNENVLRITQEIVLNSVKRDGEVLRVINPLKSSRDGVKREW